MRSRHLSAVLLAGLVALVAGCGGGDGGGSDHTGTGRYGTISASQLEVASAIPFPPFEFGTPPRYRGFDVDLVRQIAKRLRLQARFKGDERARLLSDLGDARFDMVAGGIYSATKKQGIALSQPYFPTDQALVVRRSGAFKSLRDLRQRKVAVQAHTSGQRLAEQARFGLVVKEFPSIKEAFARLKQGQFDALVYDFASSKYRAQRERWFKVVQVLSTGDTYSFAFRDDSDRLRSTVDQQLRKLKDNGIYSRIYRKWFHTPPPLYIINTPDVPQ
jgi:polar amino acid transport system substrate-binding protein